MELKRPCIDDTTGLHTNLKLFNDMEHFRNILLLCVSQITELGLTTHASWRAAKKKKRNTKVKIGQSGLCLKPSVAVTALGLRVIFVRSFAFEYTTFDYEIDHIIYPNHAIVQGDWTDIPERFNKSISIAFLLCSRCAKHIKTGMRLSRLLRVLFKKEGIDVPISPLD